MSTGVEVVPAVVVEVVTTVPVADTVLVDVTVLLVR
jgi:hypothetical protein